MKKVILGFIIGIVVCGVVGVSAYTLLAKDIAYKDTNVEDALDDLYDSLDNKSDLLWSNSDASVAFSPQIVSINLQGYPKVVVMANYNDGGDTNGTAYKVVDVGSNGQLFTENNSSNGNCSRNFTTSTTGIEFANGYWGGTTSEGRCAIPTYIIGIK